MQVLRWSRLRFRVRNRYKLWLFRAVLYVLAGYILIFAADSRLKPAIREYAQAKAVNLATLAMNDAVDAAVSRLSYEDLVTLERGADGYVSALHTNVQKVNTLKTDIGTRVVDALGSIPPSRLGIPMGNVMGLDILAGRGPMISVAVLPVGSAVCDFESSFHEAGINQTRHTISIRVSATISILLPSDSLTVTVSTLANAAETVIVGSVPDTYAVVESSAGLLGGS